MNPPLFNWKVESSPGVVGGDPRYQNAAQHSGRLGWCGPLCSARYSRFRRNVSALIQLFLALFNGLNSFLYI